jgi:putative ABC transport system substrate-binding protein
VTQTNTEVAPKRLELLHELLPTARVMALLVNRADPSVAEPITKEVQVAARTLGLELHVLNASTDRDFDAVFAELIQLRAGGLVMSAGDPIFVSRSEQLPALALHHAVPAIGTGPEFVVAGGLLSYGSDIADAYRLAGSYTGRILNGDKPADLPVQQATKVELLINANILAPCIVLFQTRRRCITEKHLWACWRFSVFSCSLCFSSNLFHDFRNWTLRNSN